MTSLIKKYLSSIKIISIILVTIGIFIPVLSSVVNNQEESTSNANILPLNHSKGIAFQLVVSSNLSTDSCNPLCPIGW